MFPLCPARTERGILRRNARLPSPNSRRWTYIALPEERQVESFQVRSRVFSSSQGLYNKPFVRGKKAGRLPSSNSNIPFLTSKSFLCILLVVHRHEQLAPAIFMLFFSLWRRVPTAKTHGGVFRVVQCRPGHSAAKNVIVMRSGRVFHD